MKKYFLLLAVLIGCLAASMTACADIGPKQGVRILFEHMPDGDCYATLLSESEGKGPWSVPDRGEKPLYEPGDEAYPVWEKFCEYQDGDGFYFWQYFEEISQSWELNWSYWPPEVFKILLYFPETDSFAVSEEICESYAFYSDYSVNLESYDAAADFQIRDGDVRKSNDYSRNIESAFLRILFTILIEGVLALLFGYRGKRNLLLILFTNIGTQVILNSLAVLAEIYWGPWSFTLCYIGIELVVLAIELVIYRKWLTRSGKEKENGRNSGAAWYAVAANVSSLVLGLILMSRFPDWF